VRNARWAAIPAAILIIQAFGAGCASHKPAPTVAIVRFTDTREASPSLRESIRAIGDEGSVAWRTTEMLATRLRSEGFRVTITADEIPSGVDAVVTGDVYRWDATPVTRVMSFAGTAIARSHMKLIKDDQVVFDRVYTGDDTGVHATALIHVPFYDPKSGPLRRALRVMVDEMAADVTNALNGNLSPRGEFSG
jgi:hypothetical protein